MSAEIESVTGIKPELIAGGGGIFDVKSDGELLFSKFDSGRFPDAGEIATLIA
ncbi:MAG: Rdx family protein [Gammaproteobacteria bacterium]|nr:hypothetical protein [Gammaproteobacteria bacterium]MDP6096506.1 Rdx family protein [Gammaproteobacteria bacterium]